MSDPTEVDRQMAHKFREKYCLGSHGPAEGILLGLLSVARQSGRDEGAEREQALATELSRFRDAVQGVRGGNLAALIEAVMPYVDGFDDPEAMQLVLRQCAELYRGLFKASKPDEDVTQYFPSLEPIESTDEPFRELLRRPPHALSDSPPPDPRDEQIRRLREACEAAERMTAETPGCHVLRATLRQALSADALPLECPGCEAANREAARLKAELSDSRALAQKFSDDCNYMRERKNDQLRQRDEARAERDALIAAWPEHIEGMEGTRGIIWQADGQWCYQEGDGPYEGYPSRDAAVRAAAKLDAPCPALAPDGTAPTPDDFPCGLGRPADEQPRGDDPSDLEEALQGAYELREALDQSERERDAALENMWVMRRIIDALEAEYNGVIAVICGDSDAFWNFLHAANRAVYDEAPAPPDIDHELTPAERLVWVRKAMGWDQGGKE